MTISETELSRGIDRYEKPRSKLNLVQEDPDLAAKTYAIELAGALFSYVEGVGSDFRRPYFVLDPSMHDDPNKAELHQKMHSYFLQELNYDPALLMGSKEDCVTIDIVEGVELIGDIQRNQNGQVCAIWYHASRPDGAS